MAILVEKVEIRGLAASVIALRDHLAGIRSQILDVQAEMHELSKTLGDMRAQITQAHLDLKFEAENLSNELNPPASNPVRDPMADAAPPPAPPPGLGMAPPKIATMSVGPIVTDHGVVPFDQFTERRG